jgi:regulator of cell morphogenesis and NO signaling
MNFNVETRVNEIALSNPGARRILEDAGVDYCCGGGKSLYEPCLRANVSAEIILDRLQQNSEFARSDESGWTKAPLAALTHHILERHHGYIRDVIPRLRGMLAKVREKHGNNHREVGEIERLFGDIAREMLMHMQKEEQILFPYIDALERSANGADALEPPFFQTVRNPIYSMMQEHDAAGELVRKIRAASNGYQAPADACTTFKAAYQELQRFEEDLHLHVHLENNILFPRTVALEAATV